MAGAIASTRHMRGISKYNGAFKGAFVGFGPILFIILLRLILSRDPFFLLSNWDTIALWSLCTMINGAPIGFFSHNRSDRHRN